MRRTFGLCAALTLTLTSLGCAKGGSSSRSPVAPRAAADGELATPKTEPPLAPVAFIAGRWVTDDGTSEETWTPSGNVMVGVAFTTRGGKTVEWEALAIDAKDGVLGYAAMINGAPPVRFEATLANESRAVFANPAHDFPKIVTYARDGRGGERLTARVEGDEASHALTFAWHAEPRAPAAALEEADRVFDEEVARRGADGWADAFDEHGAVLRGDARVEGRDAVRDDVTSLFASGAKLHWAPIASGLSKSRDLGFTVGRYALRRPADHGVAGRISHGTYLTVWTVGPKGRARVLFDTGFPETPPGR